jgi:hypothetical protein
MSVVLRVYHFFFELSLVFCGIELQLNLIYAPKTSIRQLGQQINLSVGTTHTMLTQEFTFLTLPCQSSAGIQASTLSKNNTSLQLTCRQRRQ